MASKKWRGQEAVLEASGGNLPSEPFGILQEVELAAPEQEIQQLRGAGSTEFVDVMRTSTEVSVSGELMSWDPDAYEEFVAYDDVAGELDDTADVNQFTVTVTFSASDGSTYEVPVLDCYIDGSLPIGGSREDWQGMSLEVIGRTLGDTTFTDASA